MELPAGIRPEDRILILGIPEPAMISALAHRATAGLVVAVGGREAVYEARKAARSLENVMFFPGTPDELPWRDGFFTRVIDLVGGWPDAERVEREVRRLTEGA